MNSRKLTNALREEIFEEAVRGKFDNSELLAKTQHMIYKLFCSRYRAERKTLLKAMEAFDYSGFSARNTISVHVKGENNVRYSCEVSAATHYAQNKDKLEKLETIETESYDRWKERRVGFRFPVSRLELWKLTPYTKTEERLIQQITKNVLEIENRNEKRNKLRAQVNTLLQTCNTTKQLVDAWPEAIEYFPFVDVQTGTALTVNVNEMKALFKEGG